MQAQSAKDTAEKHAKEAEAKLVCEREALSAARQREKKLAQAARESAEQLEELRMQREAAQNHQNVREASTQASAAPLLPKVRKRKKEVALSSSTEKRNVVSNCAAQPIANILTPHKSQEHTQTVAPPQVVQGQDVTVFKCAGIVLSSTQSSGSYARVTCVQICGLVNWRAAAWQAAPAIPAHVAEDTCALFWPEIKAGTIQPDKTYSMNRDVKLGLLYVSGTARDKDQHTEEQTVNKCMRALLLLH